MESLQELTKKLRLAEQNYKESRADFYLVEQHELRKKIRRLEEAEAIAAAASGDDDDQGTAKKEFFDSGKTLFVVPSNVEELRSAITKHIMSSRGEEAANLSDEEIARLNLDYLKISRDFYDKQNDKDAVARVDEMLEKVEEALKEFDGEGSGDTRDGGDTEPKGKTTEKAPETTVAVPENNGEGKSTTDTEKAPATPKKQKKESKGGKKK